MLSELIQALEKSKGKEKQLKAILTLIHLGKYAGNEMTPVLRKELINDGISLSSLNTLEKNGAVVQERLEITRFN